VRLIDTAKSRPEWTVAYHATILENETGMRGVEVRNLQLKRIDLLAGEIRLQRTKGRTSGIRTIPLSADALESARGLVMRAQNLGANQPEHYLIPALIKVVSERKDGMASHSGRYEPKRPAQSWRSAWRSLTVKAGLGGLRGHDLRHNWVTSHAEIGTPQSVLEAQAGHLSKRVSDLYKHISERAAHKASEDLARVRAIQRAAARATLQQPRATGVAGVIDSTVIPTPTDAGNGQPAVVH
jgi:integrase